MVKKMNITFILCNPDLSGGNRIIAKQARFLKDAGYEVSIIGVDTLRQEPLPKIRNFLRSIIKHRKLPPKHIITDHFDNAGIPITILKRPNGPTIEDIPDADFIVATFWMTAPWIKDMPASKGKKVYFIQGYEPSFPSVKKPKDVEKTYGYPFIQLGVSQWLCEKVKKAASQNTASLSNTSSLTKNTHISQCNLVENGIDTEVFSTPTRQKNKTPTVGVLYTPIKIKNIALSFDAIDILRQKIPNLKVICFGSSPPSPDLPLPQGSEFHLRPTQDKIKEIYSACDAWLFSSEEEGFGLPILEALACRTPVVATIAGASTQLVTDKTGSLCEKRTPEAYASHIEKILTQSDEQWLPMSENARAMAVSYDWDNLKTKFADVLLKNFDD